MTPKKKSRKELANRNKMARKNSRFKQRAERDSLLVSKKARNVGELTDRLKKYDDLKEKSLVKRGLGAMAGAAALATYFGGEDMRQARRRMRNRINTTG